MVVAGRGSAPCSAVSWVHPSSSHQDPSLKLCPVIQFVATNLKSGSELNCTEDPYPFHMEPSQDAGA